MSFTQSIRTCLSRYVTFSGRASRSEYWWFFLFVSLVGLGAMILDTLLFGSAAATVQSSEGDVAAVATAEARTPISTVTTLGLFLPHLAAAWRRMHDTGRRGILVLLPTLLMLAAGAVLIFGIGVAGLFSGGGNMDILFTRATLIILIPTVLVLLLSPLIVLVWLIRPSQPGTNAYGPNPHEVAQ